MTNEPSAPHVHSNRTTKVLASEHVAADELLVVTVESRLQRKSAYVLWPVSVTSLQAFKPAGACYNGKSGMEAALLGVRDAIQQTLDCEQLLFIGVSNATALRILKRLPELARKGFKSRHAPLLREIYDAWWQHSAVHFISVGGKKTTVKRAAAAANMLIEGQ